MVTELIRRGAAHFGERPAIRFEGETLSFAQVDLLANSMATALIGAGVAPVGARIGVLGNNSLHTIPLDFACAKARLTRVPLNARLSAREQSEMLAGMSTQVLVHGLDQCERAAELASLVPNLIRLSLGPSQDADDLLALAAASSAEPVAREPAPDDVVLALYTSGTTGRLKAAQHTQASWAAVAVNILANLVDVQPGQMMLHAASLIHASGTFVLPFWIRGGVAGILPSFSPREYCDAVAAWRPAALNLVPTMIGMLLDMAGIEEADFSSVETIIYGASPMPRPVLP